MKNVFRYNHLRQNIVKPSHLYGLTLLEFAVVLVIISTAAYFLLRGLLFAQGASEQRGFEDNVAALERALSYELMSRGTRGETMDNTVLQKENPFQWLSPKPLGYAGDYPVQTNPIPGAWYWDGRRKEVVYVSKTPDRIRLSSARNDVQSGILTDKAAKMPEVRLRVVLTGNGHVHLEPIRVFQWQIN